MANSVCKPSCLGHTCFTENYTFLSIKMIPRLKVCALVVFKPKVQFTLQRIRIRIYLLARRNLLWDILRLPSSRRAALGLYVILTLHMTRTGRRPETIRIAAYRSSPRYTLRHGRRGPISCMREVQVRASKQRWLHTVSTGLYEGSTSAGQ